MTLLSTSVLPTCAADMITTVEILGSFTASMMPRWYSARSVCHLPGSALASGDRALSRSAHSLTLRSGGGRNARIALARAFVRLSKPLFDVW